MKFISKMFFLVALALFATAPALASCDSACMSEAIQKLQTDGHLTAAAAEAASKSYAAPEASKSFFTLSFDLVTALKIAGVLLLVISFSSLIKKLIKVGWHFITIVPVQVYQLAFLGVLAGGMIFATDIYPSQSFWLTLLCSILSWVTIYWAGYTYKPTSEAFKRIVDFKSSAIGFYGLVAASFVFGAVHFDSKTYAALATVAALLATFAVIGRVFSDGTAVWTTASVTFSAYLAIFAYGFGQYQQLFEIAIKYVLPILLAIIAIISIVPDFEDGGGKFEDLNDRFLAIGVTIITSIFLFTTTSFTGAGAIVLGGIVLAVLLKLIWNLGKASFIIGSGAAGGALWLIAVNLDKLVAVVK